MAEKKKLKPKQLALIECLIANPNITNEKAAEYVGINRNTVRVWKNLDEFQEEYKKRLKEMWRDSEVIAVKTMRQLASEGNFAASKYILDSFDYVTQHIEAEVNSDIIINIE